MKSVLVIGAGLAGAVIAWECAEAGLHVTVVEKQDRVGGNCHDYDNEYGEKISSDGPHLFHADENSFSVEWLSQFTNWVKYEHRVRAILSDGRTTPLPVNRTTLEDVFDVDLGTPGETQIFLSSIQDQSIETPKNSDEVFLKSVGEELADIFFRPYTLKHWGKPATEIEAAVGARIPVRTNRDDRYFTDNFQYLPEHGFTPIFEKVFSHPRINLVLNTEYDHKAAQFFDQVFLTGPIDAHYGYRFGRLPYRSVKFIEEEIDYTPSATTMNFTDDGEYTRFTTWSKLPISKSRLDGKHTITLEKPCDPSENEGKRYYPIRNEESLNLYRRYAELAEQDGLICCGRLAQFIYYDMSPCINATYSIVDRWLKTVNQERQLVSPV